MADRIGFDNVDDVLEGTIFADFMNGKSGNDTLTAKGSNDTLIGGLGNDTMSGGDGDDLFLVGDGEAKFAETYNGGSGFDTIDLTTTIGTLTGAHESIFDISGIISIERLRFSGDAEHKTRISASHMGGSGFSDSLQVVGANALDAIFIDCNFDPLIDASAWSFSNWTGRITFETTTESELIRGTSSADIFLASAGIDKYFGNGGDDTFVLDGTQQNTEVRDGGAGRDTLKISGAQVSLIPGTYASIERLHFESQGFIAEQRVIVDADDFGSGGIAFDLELSTLGQGKEFLQIDMLGETSFSAGGFSFQPLQLDSFLIEINGGSAAENIVGSIGHDVIRGEDGVDILTSSLGNDRLDGGTGDDFMAGGAGNDTYVVDSTSDVVNELAALADAGGNDTVEASVGFTLQNFFETLILTGADAISGTGNGISNTLTGNAGANVIKGAAGADRITGGLGADSLFGGIGADRFIYASVIESGQGASLRDTIKDFDTGSDKLQLNAIDANDVLDGNQAFLLDSGGGLSQGEVRIRISGGNTLIEANTDADAAIEFQVMVAGVTNLAAGDLVL